MRLWPSKRIVKVFLSMVGIKQRGKLTKPAQTWACWVTVTYTRGLIRRWGAAEQAGSRSAGWLADKKQVWRPGERRLIWKIKKIKNLCSPLQTAFYFSILFHLVSSDLSVTSNIHHHGYRWILYSLTCCSLWMLKTMTQHWPKRIRRFVYNQTNICEDEEMYLIAIHAFIWLLSI